MNKKRIAQYCCAALVAAGIGLNIQNALSDYGIGQDSLSLVAKPGSGTNSNSNSNSNSNTNGKPFCYNGGPGSSSCSIDAGISISGYGMTGGCSVSCQSGYYACCTLRCTCVKN